MHDPGVVVLSLLYAYADWLRPRYLIGAAAGLLVVCGLLCWRAYRQRRRGSGKRQDAAPPDPMPINPEIRRSLDSLVSLACRTSGEASAKVAFRPRRLIEQATRALAERAQAKGLRFKVVVAPNVPQRVCADLSGIGLVLLNLLDNAVKFTEEGAVRLEVALTTDSHGARQLRFTVYDTGSGIDSETLAQLLSTDPPQDATESGGLPVSRRLVELMGGAMAADSEPRGGSTFWFSVPMEVVEAAPAVVAKPVPHREEIEAAQVRPLLPRAPCPGKRVLIVEPDPASQVAALWGVRALGYLGEVAANGRSAFEAWQRGPFDLVLVDCAMPEAGETIRRIRGVETGCIPIIAMNHTNGQSISIDDHLAKPLCLVVLARTLNHWLGDGAPAYTSEASSDKLSVPV